MSYKIHTDACKKCGLCQSACKFGAIAKAQRHYKILENKCVQCGHCSVACPYEAIALADGSLPAKIAEKRAERQAHYQNYQQQRQKQQWSKRFSLALVVTCLALLTILSRLYTH